VEVVPVELKPHPNADTLSRVEIFNGGYQVLVRTSDWLNQKVGAYIPPDSIVPDSPEYAFLNGKLRIKAKKLRGEWSTGLLVPAPQNAHIGDDVADILGITHYVPPEPSVSLGKALSAPSPSVIAPSYDIESFRRYAEAVFFPNELVFITEKIHGTNARFTFCDGKFHCGTRTRWIQEEEGCVWWKTLYTYHTLRAFLEANEGTVVYGEIYGQVQDLKYGHARGETSLAIFDILRQGRWLEVDAFCHSCVEFNLPTVPIISLERHYDFHALLDLAEGSSHVPGANHVREGIVVRPLKLRWHPEVGRVILKIVSNGYLERA